MTGRMRWKSDSNSLVQTGDTTLTAVAWFACEPERLKEGTTPWAWPYQGGRLAPSSCRPSCRRFGLELVTIDQGCWDYWLPWGGRRVAMIETS